MQWNSWKNEIGLQHQKCLYLVHDEHTRIEPLSHQGNLNARTGVPQLRGPRRPPIIPEIQPLIS